MRLLGGLASPDYLDLFTASTNAASQRSAEEWARAVLEGAPNHVGLPALFAQRFLLGLRLGPRRSPDHIFGWKIAGRGDGWVRIEAASWLMTGAMVFKVDEARLYLATFVRYERRITALVWPPGSLFHRRVGLTALRHAIGAR
jgi:hypothetical protein